MFGFGDELVNGFCECGWGMVDEKECSLVSFMLLTGLFLLMSRCLLGFCPVTDLLHCWQLALDLACHLEFLAVFWAHL